MAVRSAEYSRAWHAKNKDRVNAKRRAAYDGSRRQDMDLRRRYGITAKDYDAMLVAQGGLCAICDQPPTTKRLAVDHCHETGEVRGLLCIDCNNGIGRLGDCPDRVARAAAYLLANKRSVR